MMSSGKASFAGGRRANADPTADRYIDGHDYFYAVSEMLENAQEAIFIADWWLTPELFLRRPPAEHEDVSTLL